MNATNGEAVLTSEESDFAALHHKLIYKFLRKNGLSEDEYYDVAVFGYLDAVRDYFREDGLSGRRKFGTVAFRHMFFGVADHWRARNRMKRKADVRVYVEDADASARREIGILPEAALLEKEARAKLGAALTPRRSGALRLRAEGYDCAEIGKMLGIGRREVLREIGAAAPALREYAAELRNVAA
jgi:RNA polymerase sigma-70 factor (ECF subfamily)